MKLHLFEANPSLLPDIKARYAEPHRHYHTWVHIEHLLSLFDGLSGQFANSESVLYALYYHDAIYDIPGPNNEEDSAALFAENAAGTVSKTQVDDVFALIVATQAHDIPDSMPERLRSDCALFLDMDMSILGGSEKLYDQYAKGVRAEYQIFPAELYNIGRAKVLREFLARDAIFLTEHFNEEYEDQARMNIEKELTAL